MDGYGEPRRSQWNVWIGFTIGGGMQVKPKERNWATTVPL